MRKIIFAAIAVLFLTTSGLNATTSFRGQDCWAAADAAEVHHCGEVGCDFGLWSAVFDACYAYEL